LLFLYKHTRIHLDKVKGLGEFIELETVFNTNLADKIFIEEHNQVKNLLGLEMFPTVSGSYSDLLLNKQK
jgi:adenylate cyclase class IV